MSRNAAFKQVHIVMQKLDEYEKDLGLYKKNIELTNLAQQIKEGNEELSNKILER